MKIRKKIESEEAYQRAEMEKRMNLVHDAKEAAQSSHVVGSSYKSGKFD